MDVAKVGESTLTVLKLSELTRLYATYLPKQEQQCPQPESQVHSTRFKERPPSNCPNVTAVSHGRDVLMTFKDNVGIALQQAVDRSDLDAVHLMHTVKLLRNEIFFKKCSFNGSLLENSKAVTSFAHICNYVTRGPGNVEVIDNEAAISLSQVILFNAVRPKRRKPTSSIDMSECQRSTSVRHSPSLPVYIDVMLH